MINAQKELIEHIDGGEVEFVSIAFQKEYGSEPLIIKGSLNDILPMLDFNYDNGYGGQELFGYIWFTDGTWSERREYDGSEWWERKERPDKDIKVEPY